MPHLVNLCDKNCPTQQKSTLFVLYYFLNSKFDMSWVFTVTTKGTTVKNVSYWMCKAAKRCPKGDMYNFIVWLYCYIYLKVLEYQINLTGLEWVLEKKWKICLHIVRWNFYWNKWSYYYSLFVDSFGAFFFNVFFLKFEPSWCQM